jgi:CRISPR-associated exonuclease Cas4
MSDRRVPLTVTHLLEHLFCPRFTFFEHVLQVPERQERRQLVRAGRQAHEERKRINPGYLRKKLGVVARRGDVPLASERLGIRGVVDEVLTLADGTLAPFDYKYAEWKGQVFHNLKMQSVVYGLLIEEALGAPVRRGWLCYLRSKHRVEEVEHRPEDKEEAKATLADVLKVVRGEVYPEATKWKARCRDCCYRNVCLK